MAIIIPIHIPMKIGMDMSLGILPPTWPNPVAISDIEPELRAVTTQAAAANANNDMTSFVVSGLGRRP
jgi:hypothetical protein